MLVLQPRTPSSSVRVTIRHPHTTLNPPPHLPDLASRTRPHARPATHPSLYRHAHQAPGAPAPPTADSPRGGPAQRARPAARGRPAHEHRRTHVSATRDGHEEPARAPGAVSLQSAPARPRRRALSLVLGHSSRRRAHARLSRERTAGVQPSQAGRRGASRVCVHDRGHTAQRLRTLRGACPRVRQRCGAPPACGTSATRLRGRRGSRRSQPFARPSRARRRSPVSRVHIRAALVAREPGHGAFDRSPCLRAWHADAAATLVSPPPVRRHALCRPRSCGPAAAARAAHPAPSRSRVRGARCLRRVRRGCVRAQLCCGGVAVMRRSTRARTAALLLLEAAAPAAASGLLRACTLSRRAGRGAGLAALAGSAGGIAVPARDAPPERCACRQRRARVASCWVRRAGFLAGRDAPGPFAPSRGRGASGDRRRDSGEERVASPSLKPAVRRRVAETKSRWRRRRARVGDTRGSAA
ncbi:hypothetical protein PsYK624_074720 [Phanerochaete sordida]|uniref:Uncharacterized protein n=1 Tax=Phanerochaete sordida TaxID=48140 RepID=A0A9P3G8I7_9APHY|nr:hypothetical protein PsYK624_074720 [Phanerochaete sordida]